LESVGRNSATRTRTGELNLHHSRLDVATHENKVTTVGLDCGTHHLYQLSESVETAPSFIVAECHLSSLPGITQNVT
jgi:hypothetical protein